MAVYMTADVDCNRKPCNMRRIGINMNRQNGRGTAQSAGADSCLVRSCKTSFSRLLTHSFLNVPLSCAAVLFRHQGAFLKGTADTDTDNHGGQAFGPAILYRRQDSF